MKSLQQNITIKRDETQPESMELVAKSIIDIADGFQKMEKCGAKRKLTVLLLHDMTGVSKRDIGSILDAAVSIRSTYLR